MPDSAEAPTHVKRRKFAVLRVADAPSFDIHALLRGELVSKPEAECTLLCPIRGKPLRLVASELGLFMRVPVDRWASVEELQLSGDERALVVALARRGLLLADPVVPEWADIASGEDTISRVGWTDLAMAFHAHSRWQGISGSLEDDRSDEAHRERLEKLRESRGTAPPHFVRREDAQARRALDVPALEGPFFEALLARRTTRAYAAGTSLPLSRLETVLYAVFGAHGIKEFAPGISAIRRTSPSGGALHPIEAYVIAIDVAGLACGVYHYETGTHALALLEPLEVSVARQRVSDFTAGQTYFGDAHAAIIQVGRFDRNLWKYANHGKAYKTVLMDAAHLSQTLYLTAAHLGLGAFVTAAINDADIGDMLRLDPLREAAIVVNGIGIAEAGRDDLHFITEPYRPAGID